MVAETTTAVGAVADDWLRPGLQREAGSARARLSMRRATSSPPLSST
jgi:hypothetical protein